MPELPEVETIIRGLKTALIGQKIQSVNVNYSGCINTSVNYLQKTLSEQIFTNISRRGKLILCHLNTHILAIHLKMTGRLWVTKKDVLPTKHTHIICKLYNHDSLLFEDMRKFGYFHLFTPEELKNLPFLCKLGIEPLEMTEQDFLQILNRKIAIKSLLLNQSIIAGIGNIYADESLFAAKIHPLTPAINIPDNKKIQLFIMLKKILNEAIEAGGSSFKDYRDAFGKTGLFQEKFTVYGKKGQSCILCKNTLQTIKVAGRTSTICLNCQEYINNIPQ